MLLRRWRCHAVAVMGRSRCTVQVHFLRFLLGDRRKVYFLRSAKIGHLQSQVPALPHQRLWVKVLDMADYYECCGKAITYAHGNTSAWLSWRIGEAYRSLSFGQLGEVHLQLFPGGRNDAARKRWCYLWNKSDKAFDIDLGFSIYGDNGKRMAYKRTRPEGG